MATTRRDVIGLRRLLLAFSSCSLLVASLAADPPVVVGFERFGTGAKADLRESGEILLSELHCTACHATDEKSATRINSFPAPVLDAVGQRVRPEYLRRWIAEPHAVKPGTVMPDMLASVAPTERAQVVEALTHYLASLRPNAPQTVVSGSVERGRQIYHRIGCIACHAPDPDYPPPTSSPGVKVPKPEVPSVPLGKLGEKYTVGALQAFLLDPLAVRPGARMPQVPMTSEEAADLASYLCGDAPASAALAIDPALAKQGQQHFSQLGCANCHAVAGVAAAQHQPLAALKVHPDSGCLAPQPPAGIPQYALNGQQRAALVAALQHIDEAEPPSPASSAHRLMTSLNCFACHQRDGQGGPEPGRAAFFGTVEEVDLGDEGRLPPTLTGVGAKLQTAAIEQVILGEGAVRPYMATRMPNFGSGHASQFARLFTDADYHPPKEPLLDNGRNTVGRDLMGMKGVVCITCHGLQGHKSLGVPAIDLMYATKRLRRDWFHAYLVDPNAFRPGTRMPSFWPGGLPANEKFGKGKPGTAHQIDSIWVYLKELDQSRLPEGLENKGDYELKPSNKPMVFRTFMNGVSMQAIAVGFPQGLHVAFDAKAVRWAIAWRGAFLDAEGTWEERAAPLAEPLSKDVAPLSSEVQFAQLNDANTPWPAQVDVRFGGYRLAPSGVPTFLYRVGKLEIEDRVEPDPTGRSLKREIRLSHGDGSWFFRAATGKNIAPGAPGEWRIDQTRLQLPPAVPASVRESGQQQELLVPIRFDANGTATLTTEFTW